MTTPPPEGRLLWAQPLSYDAVEDRLVIRALARGRIGTLAQVTAEAGSGLQVIVRGGWLAVASCDDGTSAVVGAREDHVVAANAGPASGGSREDWLWCETHPDEGSWELRILPAGQAAQLPGIQLATITVPQGANLAAQMTIIGTTAELDRRLLSFSARNYEWGEGGWSDTSWGNAGGNAVVSEPVTVRPGQWYRVIHELNSVDVIQGSGQAAIGVGWRPTGQAQNTTVLHRAEMVQHNGYRLARGCRVQWTFRNYDSAPSSRIFEGRYWVSQGNGLYRMGTVGGFGDHQVLTVEDMGS